MWVMNGSMTEIINTQYVERFLIIEESDTFLLRASYGETRAKTVARYRTREEASKELVALLQAVSENERYYFVSASTLNSDSQKSKNYYHGHKRKKRGVVLDDM